MSLLDEWVLRQAQHPQLGTPFERVHLPKVLNRVSSEIKFKQRTQSTELLYPTDAVPLHEKVVQGSHLIDRYDRMDRVVGHVQPFQ